MLKFINIEIQTFYETINIQRSMLDVRCSTFNLFTVSASLTIKKPCHFGVVSYKRSGLKKARQLVSKTLAIRSVKIRLLLIGILFAWES